MSDNMKLWDKVCETDPSHTKKVTFGRGFTAIDPMHQVRNATKQFGAAGKGWGWEVGEPTFLPTNEVCVLVTLRHSEGVYSISQFGQASLYIDGAEKKKDTDCMKKATTDGLTKCLSYLGFNADVFLGKFDDNKYVQEMEKKHKDPYKATEEEIYLIKDVNYLIANCADQVELSSTMEQLSSKISPLHDDLQAYISQQETAAAGLFREGKKFQTNTYHFAGVDHGKDYVASCTKVIVGAKDGEKLTAWFERWIGKTKALDTILKGPGYKVEGKSPYEQLQKLYDDKIITLQKERKHDYI